MKNSFLKLLHQYVEAHPSEVLSILDIGCGNGDLVYQLRQSGYDAFGIDVRYKNGNHTEELKSNGYLKTINIGDKSRENLFDADVYKWPDFEKKFDVMFSVAVIEHVPDMDTFCSEAFKQIVNNGLMLHYFPSRWSVIEPHTGIPFGAICSAKIYYQFCCYTGLCFKNYFRSPERAINYMRTYTFYRDISKLKRIYRDNNLKLEEITHEMLQLSSNKVIRFMAKYRIVSLLFSLLRSKVVLVRPIL